MVFILKIWDDIFERWNVFQSYDMRPDHDVMSFITEGDMENGVKPFTFDTFEEACLCLGMAGFTAKGDVLKIEISCFPDMD